MKARGIRAVPVEVFLALLLVLPACSVKEERAGCPSLRITSRHMDMKMEKNTPPVRIRHTSEKGMETEPQNRLARNSTTMPNPVRRISLR